MKNRIRMIAFVLALVLLVLVVVAEFERGPLASAPAVLAFCAALAARPRWRHRSRMNGIARLDNTKILSFAVFAAGIPIEKRRTQNAIRAVA